MATLTKIHTIQLDKILIWLYKFTAHGGRKLAVRWRHETRRTAMPPFRAKPVAYPPLFFLKRQFHPLSGRHQEPTNPTRALGWR